ncbi:hypothetical protein COT29_02175 [Candidatus Micrarchaeota archaeon CG08_land_8_20_14_0_20_59_11]|nr:MAG: hypothetical protein COT29_02175 [Candidatus Micrarchaeota archaeon CG08_land_8_20_14_0_20_59_11]
MVDWVLLGTLFRLASLVLAAIVAIYALAAAMNYRRGGRMMASIIVVALLIGTAAFFGYEDDRSGVYYAVHVGALALALLVLFFALRQYIHGAIREKMEDGKHGMPNVRQKRRGRRAR